MKKETSNTLAPSPFATLIDHLCQSDIANQHFIGDALLQLSYADLPRYISAIENALHVSSISPDDCVAFECQNTTPALLTLLALLYRGQHILLLPPEGNPMKEPGFTPQIPTFCKQHLTINALNTELDTTPATIASLMNSYSNASFAETAFQRLSTDKPLLLLRTSGSMGDAKIVCFNHTKLVGNAKRCIERFGLESASRVTIAVPIFHMYGLGAGLIPSLLVGASIDIQANTNILRFLAHERRFNPTTVYLNPTICSMLLKGRRGDKLYKRTISAGAPLPASVATDYQNRFGPISNLYGSTEMGVIATESPSASSVRHFKPLPGVTMCIEDDEHNNALFCKHPDGFDSYINQHGNKIPLATFPFDTGDRAESADNETDEFKLIGRQGNSTNRSGFLVQFDDIEDALLKTGKVEQSLIVITQEETIRGLKLYAFCVAKKTTASEKINEHSIRQASQSLLPKYAVPDEIILMKQLPLSASGKIDRQALTQHIAHQKQEITQL